MKRPLLTLVCCLPLLFSAPSSFSLNLIGPSGEQAVSYEQYGPISSVETLWGIASKLRPDDSVTTQQTLVAIYKINPSAFYKGDINKIIPQSVIKVPSLEFIQEQTAKEAAALINKYSPQKRSGTLQSKQPKTAKVTQPKQPPRPVPEIAAPENPKSAPEKIVDKEALATLKNELQSLRNEFEVVNEQLLVETEANQTLKLKLQPLYEQIDSLKKQLDSELLTHSRLQKMVDDYRAQLDAVKARPFSGEGLLNEILRLITSSLTNLLIVIVSPILILLTIFAVIMRLYSKHLLEAQEQELAESTARLMEESGKFDSLLTDDICEETELDFTSDDSLIQDAIKEEQVNESELVSLEDEYKEIDLTDVDNISKESETVQTAQDEAAIAALLDEEALETEIELLEATEDDPFGIAALAEEEDLIVSVPDDDSESEHDAQQADLDLAAEWESQLSEQTADEPGKEKLEESISDFAALSEADLADGETDLFAGEEIDLSELELAEVELQPEIDLSEKEFDIQDLTDLDALLQEKSSAVDEPQQISPTEAIDLDTIDLDTDWQVPEQKAEETAAVDDNSRDDSSVTPENKKLETDDSDDLLAKQLSDIAFNGDVPLPKVDKPQENDFIDIETLLENSNTGVNEEPYSEPHFDLGLDEFPDVINASGAVELDDNENGIAVQLDLARAYIEIDDKDGAKEILLSVVADSEGAQRNEIEKLLKRLA